MSFTAQFPGSCAKCNGQLKGKECTYLDDDVVHVSCPETEDDTDFRPIDKAKLCTKCWCEHVGDCA